MSHVRIGPSSSNPVSSNTHIAGADPEIEEGGGGHTYRLGIGAACVGHSCLCAR